MDNNSLYIYVQQQRQYVLSLLHCRRVLRIPITSGLITGEEQPLQETLQVALLPSSLITGEEQPLQETLQVAPLTSSLITGDEQPLQETL